MHRPLIFFLAVLVASHVAFAAGYTDRYRSVFSGGTLSLDLTLSSGTQLFLPTGGSATDPSLVWGDGDSGFYESVDDNLVLTVAGVARIKATGNSFQGVISTSFLLLNESASSTNPTVVPDQMDATSGIGGGSSTVHLISSGVSQLKASSSGVTIDNGITTPTTLANAATYQTLCTDYFIRSTYSATGAQTITLESDCVADGATYVIKDAGGNAGTFNITIATEGAETIDGAATATISVNYNSITLISDGTNWLIF